MKMTVYQLKTQREGAQTRCRPAIWISNPLMTSSDQILYSQSSSQTIRRNHPGDKQSATFMLLVWYVYLALCLNWSKRGERGIACGSSRWTENGGGVGRCAGNNNLVIVWGVGRRTADQSFTTCMLFNLTKMALLVVGSQLYNGLRKCSKKLAGVDWHQQKILQNQEAKGSWMWEAVTC